MVEILIKNKSNYKGEGVYVGRPSTLGNPFRITKTQTREMAVDRYAIWLIDAIKFEDPVILYELEHLFAPLLRNEPTILICWCSPKLCHADVLKRVLLNKYHTGHWLVGERIDANMEEAP